MGEDVVLASYFAYGVSSGVLSVRDVLSGVWCRSVLLPNDRLPSLLGCDGGAAGSVELGEVAGDGRRAG